MDGIGGRGSQVIIIGATNRLDSIDPALRRPGRFDYELYFGLPDSGSRLAMLKSWSKYDHGSSNMNVDGQKRVKVSVQEPFLKGLADSLEGCNGADVKVCLRFPLCNFIPFSLGIM
jgi:SpoVK/Ycf46/Vps4 family AAA+-type ATPase